MTNKILLVAACASAWMFPTAHVHAGPPDSTFDIAMVAISGTAWESIKYNTETGEAWIALGGKWVEIEDEKSLPKGRYVIKLTGLSNDWSAVRMEVMTGASWQCRQGKWVTLTEAAPTPTPAPATNTATVKPVVKTKE
jgi:hypothetical protein